jgi:hypothetical protein
MIRKSLDWLKSLGPQALVFGALSLVLASGAGFLAATTLGAATQAPTTTTTINAAVGQTGPAGPPGPPGPGITMKGTVPTVAALPTTGNKQGDTYIVQSDGSMQVWDGTKWVSGGPVGGTGSGSGGPEGCPAGSKFEGVQINHEGGSVTIWTCVAT